MEQLEQLQMEQLEREQLEQRELEQPVPWSSWGRSSISSQSLGAARTQSSSQNMYLAKTVNMPQEEKDGIDLRFQTDDVTQFQEVEMGRTKDGSEDIDLGIPERTLTWPRMVG